MTTRCGHRTADLPATTGQTEGGGPLSSCRKLLSHRCRGFGYAEATPEAVRAALSSGVRYLELDTRVDADGVIYARHDARIRTDFRKKAVHDVSAEALSQYQVARLADLFEIAAKMMDRSQTLCLDIKDFGFEGQHIALVEQFGLAGQTIFVSWIPHALAALHAIAPSYPLIFTHINLHFLPFGAGRAFSLLGERELRVRDYVVLGPRAMERPLRHAAGFQHALFARDLPDHFIRRLAASGGGICVPTYCVCDELDDWCTRHSLQQWVYTANDANTYQRLCRREAIQVIFSDDPLRVAANPA